MKKTYRPSICRLANLPVFILLLCSGFSAQSQSPLYFHSPELIDGEAGKPGATYKFSGVITASNGQALTDCLVRIDAISAGVELLDIDQAESADKGAFQPVIEHQKTIGAAAVSFRFQFVPAEGTLNASGKYTFNTFSAALSGLNGLQNAQQFAECAIGKNAMVMLPKANNQVLVAKSGAALRAQYKWDAQHAANQEPIVFASKEVSEFKIRVGVNSKMNPWEGKSAYRIALSEQIPVVAAAETIHFTAVAEQLNAEPVTAVEPSEERAADVLPMQNHHLSENLLVFVPDDMVNEQLTIEILNAKGELKRKLIEDKAPAQLWVSMRNLAAGSYKVQITAGSKKFSMLTIRASQL